MSVVKEKIMSIRMKRPKRSDNKHSKVTICRRLKLRTNGNSMEIIKLVSLKRDFKLYRNYVCSFQFTSIILICVLCSFSAFNAFNLH